jgi:hypothetical protein
VAIKKIYLHIELQEHYIFKENFLLPRWIERVSPVEVSAVLNTAEALLDSRLPTLMPTNLIRYRGIRDV